MTRPILTIDAALRRAYGIFEYSSDPGCMFRLRRIRAERALTLRDVRIPRGSKLLELHVFNEHWPRLSNQGADTAWAKRLTRLVLASLRDVAVYVQRHPELAAARAVGGPSLTFSPTRGTGTAKLTERLGFVTIDAPRRTPVLELLDRLYLWRLTGAYQPVQTPLAEVLVTRRVELWIPMDEFLRRYAGEATVAESAA
jgi:hypothetical protein